MNNTQQTAVTLDVFTVNTYPSFDHLHEATPQPAEEIINTVNEVERFNTSITLNGRGPFYVGGMDGDYRVDAHRLYHDPTEAGESGLAGWLLVKSVPIYDGEDEYSIGFKSPDCEVGVVESVDVEQHGRTTRLDDLLPELRTELTDTDWIAGDSDTGYSEWLDASGTMADFAEDIQNEAAFNYPPQEVMRAETMHALARYPLDAIDCLGQIERALAREHEDGVETATPEGFRQLLFEYAASEL